MILRHGVTAIDTCRLAMILHAASLMVLITPFRHFAIDMIRRLRHAIMLPAATLFAMPLIITLPICHAARLISPLPRHFSKMMLIAMLMLALAACFCHVDAVSIRHDAFTLLFSLMPPCMMLPCHLVSMLGFLRRFRCRPRHTPRYFICFRLLLICHFAFRRLRDAGALFTRHGHAQHYLRYC